MTKRPTFGLIATIVLILVGLAVLDRALEQAETADMASSSRQAYLTGTTLLEAGEPDRAIDFLRSAHAMARDSREYEIQLIVALMDAKKNAEAEPLMNELLQRAPNDGIGNLVAARLANEEGRVRDAEAYYHRAIYGDWPANAAGRRIAARMELIGFLREKGTRPALLAELISLEAEAPPDKATQRTLARLFLAAGAPGRAADIYQTLIEQDRGDTSAFAGLGEAQLQQGRYREAHAAFLQAFFHAPTDTAIRSRLQLLNTVMALDPTPRELSSLEKYRRSLRILDLTRESLGQCDSKNDLIAQADEMLANKAPAHVANELAEKVLTLGEALWQARVEACAGIPASEDALRLIMDKLAAKS